MARIAFDRSGVSASDRIRALQDILNRCGVHPTIKPVEIIPHDDHPDSREWVVSIVDVASENITTDGPAEAERSEAVEVEEDAEFSEIAQAGND